MNPSLQEAESDNLQAKPTLALVHGAGLGPWVWDGLRKHLQVDSAAWTYPGRTIQATPESCADAMAAEWKGGDVVLVLHSLAGILAGPLAKRLGNRLKHLVLISAILPLPQQSFAQAMGFPIRWILPLLFRLNPKGLKPSPAMIRNELCHDLLPDVAAMVVDRYEAEFPGLYLTAPGPLVAECPRTYVQLLQDRSMTPQVQARMMRNGAIPKRFSLDAGHLAMLSQPEKLANLLDAICGMDHANPAYPENSRGMGS